MWIVFTNKNSNNNNNDQNDFVCYYFQTLPQRTPPLLMKIFTVSHSSLGNTRDKQVHICRMECYLTNINMEKCHKTHTLNNHTFQIQYNGNC